MSQLSNYLFGKVSRSFISAKIYTLMFLLGLGGTLASMFELFNAKLGGNDRVGYFVVILAIGTVIQQVTIYNDLHLIEEDPTDAEKEYPAWLNMRLEVAIRIGIIILLLFGVGKIAETFYPLAKFIRVESLRRAVTEFLQPENNTSVEFSRNFFVKGSAGVFLLLLIWNSFALFYRCRSWPTTAPRSDRVKEFVITLRVVVFTVLSLLCAGYWWSVLLRYERVADLAEIVFICYLLMALMVLVLRFECVRNRVGAWLLRLFN